MCEIHVIMTQIKTQVIHPIYFTNLRNRNAKRAILLYNHRSYKDFSLCQMLRKLVIEFPVILTHILKRNVLISVVKINFCAFITMLMNPFLATWIWYCLRGLPSLCTFWLHSVQVREGGGALYYLETALYSMATSCLPLVIASLEDSIATCRRLLLVCLSHPILYLHKHSIKLFNTRTSKLCLYF